MERNAILVLTALTFNVEFAVYAVRHTIIIHRDRAERMILLT
jgi:hypothetical protein